MAEDATSVSLRALREILRRYPDWAQPLEEPELLGGAGGHSGARLWRYHSARGPLVLRAWPPHGPGREHLETVHHWLSLTANLGFIPPPVDDRVGHSFQEFGGRLWEITPWMSGTAELSRPPPAGRVHAAFTSLAAFHQRLACEARAGDSPGLRLRVEEISRLIRGGFDELEHAIDGARAREPDAALDEHASGWLKLARALAPGHLDPLCRAASQVVALQPCLRDARPEHFLFEGDRVSGLVDFGAMGVDSVAADLARLIGEWLGADPRARAEALASYERVRPLEPAETNLIAAFEVSSALLIGAHWARWHYLEARRFDDPAAVTDGLARGLGHLERLAHSGERNRLLQ